MGSTDMLSQTELTIGEGANFSHYEGDSTLITTLNDITTSQPGDSGSPPFVDGRIAGVSSVAPGVATEKSSNSIAFFPRGIPV